MQKSELCSGSTLRTTCRPSLIAPEALRLTCQPLWSPETRRLLLRHPRVVGLDWMLLRPGIHAIHTCNSLSPKAWPFDGPPLGVSFVDQHIKLDRAIVQCQSPRFQKRSHLAIAAIQPIFHILDIGSGQWRWTILFFCARKDEKGKSEHVNFRRVCDHRTPHARMGTPHLRRIA